MGLPPSCDTTASRYAAIIEQPKWWQGLAKPFRKWNVYLTRITHCGSGGAYIGSKTADWDVPLPEDCHVNLSSYWEGVFWAENPKRFRLSCPKGCHLLVVFDHVGYGEMKKDGICIVDVRSLSIETNSLKLIAPLLLFERANQANPLRDSILPLLRCSKQRDGSTIADFLDDPTPPRILRKD
jgi:hypothetical protein